MPKTRPSASVRGQKPAVSLDAGPSGYGVDKLTGLATRLCLIERIQTLMEQRSDPTRRLALVMLDLDRFKMINDSLGPAICDNLLIKIADRMKRVVRGADMIARVSGDGFAVLLRDSSDARGIAHKVLEYIARPYAVGGHAITLGASIGTAVEGEHGDDALGLVHAADLAMHQAEREGGNRVKPFDPLMQERAFLRHSMELDLRAAIARQEVELRRALVSQQFEVHYQPQVSLVDGRVTGFEALLRWSHPERGFVPPDQFIPMAEEMGLIDLLGDWVLRTACRDAMGWTVPPGQDRLRVAVNVSPVQLRSSAALLAGINRALAESGLPAHGLEVEITESAMAADIADTLWAIRRLDVGLALDDFGTGYSSLGRLRKFPFTKLKIDRSFVSGLGEDGDTADGGSETWMIRAIASLGKGLGLGTVVEGIETAAQKTIAQHAGCCEMQGYLVSKPVPAHAVNALIRQLVHTHAEG